MQPAEAVSPKNTSHLMPILMCCIMFHKVSLFKFLCQSNQDSLRMLQAHIDIINGLGKINHKKTVVLALSVLIYCHRIKSALSCKCTTVNNSSITSQQSGFRFTLQASSWQFHCTFLKCACSGCFG